MTLMSESQMRRLREVRHVEKAVRKGHRWSEEQKSKFFERYAEHATCPQIAAELGLPLYIVEGHRDYLRRDGKIPVRRKGWLGDEDKACTLWKEGKSIGQIAVILHRKKSAIQEKLKGLGFQDDIGREDRIRGKKRIASNAQFIALLLEHHPELETRL
jgi:hypothetical protein